MMSNFKKYIRELCFFVEGREWKVVFLVIIAVGFGLIESLSISLLYPMLSEGFNIDRNAIPLYWVFERVSLQIPGGSIFVNLGEIFIFFIVLSFCLQLVYWKVAYIFNKEIIVSIKQKMFDHIKTIDYNFFVETKQGDLINSFNQSPAYINLTFISALSLCSDLISACMIVCMLFFLSPAGLFIVLGAGVVLYIILRKISKISEQLGRLQIESGQSENMVLSEYIHGVKAISATNSFPIWEKNYLKAIRIFWSKYTEYMFVQKIPVLAINSLVYIGIGGIVLILYIFYAEDFMAIIPIIGTFAAGMLKVLPKFTNMGDYFLQLKSYAPHVDTVYCLLHESKFKSVKDGDLIFQGLSSDITFENLSFQYQDKRILEEINVTIRKGLITALVGVSGSGKTTITNLLLRLYDPIEGKIIINGIDLRDYNIGSFRDKIGYVGQEPFIYNTSIRENISFGGNYLDEEVIWAAKLAHADHFIEELPESYNTITGDRGLKLSGGEKQRIVIARAMIRHPDLLILDEATSSLDNVSESVVQTAIDDVSRECTTLIIAHRLSTIQNADVIYVLDKGRIIEEGNHVTLLEKKGKYWEMYNSSQSNQ